MVEMLRIDIGDNGQRAIKPQEATVAFICLNHHPVAGPEARVRAVAVDDAAVYDRRVNAAMVEHRGNQRRCCRLAMRASHRDRVLQAHQFGEHFGTSYQGYAPFQSSVAFWITSLYRS